MFQFFKKIFGQNNYNKEKELISVLKNDHKQLIEIYLNIHNFMEKNDFTQAQNEVKKFVSEYNKHILLEDTKLYIELEEKYADKKQILKTIQKIGKDMNSITRAISFFERKYNIITNDNKILFMEELKNIGGVLTQRVELEEERLYPLL